MDPHDGRASASPRARPGRSTSATRSRAVANRRFAATGCCCGSTTPIRRGTCPAARRRSSATSSGSASRWDEGPVRQSERARSHARRRRRWPRALRRGRHGPLRRRRRCCARTAPRRTTSRASSTTSTSGSRTSSAATTTGRTRRCTGGCARRSAAEPPEYVHHGLILGADGKKLSKRAGARPSRRCARRASRPRRCAPTSTSSGCRAHDVQLDLRAHPPARDRGDRGDDRRRARRARGRSASSSRRRCAARATSSRRASSRGRSSSPQPVALPAEARPTLERFRELRERRTAARRGRRASVVRELKAVGGDLTALRLALTGRERGPSSGRWSPRCRRGRGAAAGRCELYARS